MIDLGSCICWLEACVFSAAKQMPHTGKKLCRAFAGKRRSFIRICSIQLELLAFVEDWEQRFQTILVHVYNAAENWAQYPVKKQCLYTFKVQTFKTHKWQDSLIAEVDLYLNILGMLLVAAKSLIKYH